MYKIDYRKRLAQVAAVALLTCSAIARADNCAGGMDATGNGCNGEQAVRELSEAESHLLYLQGQAVMAELRAARAKQRLTDGAADVKAEEAALKAARVALSNAEKTEQRHLVARAR